MIAHQRTVGDERHGTSDIVDDAMLHIASDPLGFFRGIADHVIQEILSNHDGAQLDAEDVRLLLIDLIGSKFAQGLVGEVADERPSLAATARRESLLDELAFAVGACCCWAEDPACVECEGNGVSGWVKPDRQLFNTYVRPVLQRRTSRGRRPQLQVMERMTENELHIER